MSHRKELLPPNILKNFSDLTNLRYEDQKKIFQLIIENYKFDAIVDDAANHPQLSKRLASLAEIIESTVIPEIDRIINICEPYNNKK